MTRAGALIFGSFRTYVPRPEADTALFCFPHAGGAASFFSSWASLAPAQVAIHAAQYPGREDRFGEPLATGISKLADAMAVEVLAVRERRVILFGHSLGALLAYEVACRLEESGTPASRLVVSGMGAPHHVSGAFSRLEDLPSAMAELRRLGGTDSEVLDAPGLLEFLAAVFKADSDLAAEYRHTQGKKLTATPVDVFLGDRDPDLGPAQAEHWAELAARAQVTVFPGDHFYLTPQRTEVLASVLRPQVA
ncbi:thioesterase II family protein [Kitasatospora sp. NPDC048296]|uniref:thioesterase II family protein n=1 Tax=Kitasatospora sp. NPDC048296 TaxID=3364048 RepID=UPI0037200B27